MINIPNISRHITNDISDHCRNSTYDYNDPLHRSPFFGRCLQEVPQEDRRESEKGCHWTARLKMELCGGDGCHESEILAFDFQRRAWEFYEA